MSTEIARRAEARRKALRDAVVQRLRRVADDIEQGKLGVISMKQVNESEWAPEAADSAFAYQFPTGVSEIYLRVGKVEEE